MKLSTGQLHDPPLEHPGAGAAGIASPDEVAKESTLMISARGKPTSQFRRDGWGVRAVQELRPRCETLGECLGSHDRHDLVYQMLPRVNYYTPHGFVLQDKVKSIDL